MIVEVITSVYYKRYSIAVIVDGVVREKRSVEHFEVIRTRNEYCEDWADRADIVTARPIPQIPTLIGGPLERKRIG